MASQRPLAPGEQGFRRLGDVPRIERPPRSDFERQYLVQSRPAVVSGALDDWPALAKWSADWFAGRFGDRVVQVNVSSSPRFTFSGRSRREMTMRDAVARMRQGGGPEWFYMQLDDAGEALPGLEEDIAVPTLVPLPHRSLEMKLWLGGEGNISPLHFHRYHYLLTQVVGGKRVVLFEPGQLHRLYPDSVGLHHVSSVDIDRPDLSRFPRLRRAASIETVIGAGDMLFIPAYWWHQVYSLDLAATISYSWLADLSQCLVPGFFRQIGMGPIDRNPLWLRPAIGLARFLARGGNRQAAEAVARLVVRAARRRPGTAARSAMAA